jgi:hypothetical protein
MSSAPESPTGIRVPYGREDVARNILGIIQTDMQNKTVASYNSIRAAAYAQAMNVRKRRGAASTILTSPLGALGDPQTHKATLG